MCFGTEMAAEEGEGSWEEVLEALAVLPTLAGEGSGEKLCRGGGGGGGGEGGKDDIIHYLKR